MNCGCHMCRLAGTDCEPHDKGERRWARYKDGCYYWGSKVNSAKGRWVKVCFYCIDDMGNDGDPAALSGVFGLGGGSHA